MARKMRLFQRHLSLTSHGSACHLHSFWIKCTKIILHFEMQDQRVIFSFANQGQNAWKFTPTKVEHFDWQAVGSGANDCALIRQSLYITILIYSKFENTHSKQRNSVMRRSDVDNQKPALFLVLFYRPLAFDCIADWFPAVLRHARAAEFLSRPASSR